MASKFQNRLVGSLILVAVGVIVLPSLLDGEKRHYEEKFAAIPLVPKEGDEQDIDLLPPVTQPLLSSPTNPPAQEPPTEEAAPTAPPAAEQGQPITVPPAERQESQQEKAQEETVPVVTPPPVVEKSDKPAVSQESNKAKQEAASSGSTPPAAPESRERAPAGSAWVIQLGALKNAAKVEEIVARLRLSGYRVYTIPSKAVSGELTRIYVGPNVSKETLEGQLAELKSLSGLSGQVRGYKP
ncbi:MAG: cell division protein DedD [Enterobacteriaceae bacterium]